MNKTILRIALFVSSLLLSCMAAEWLVCIYRPQPLTQAIPPYQNSSYLKPGTYRNKSPEFDVAVHVNTQGFIDQDWLPDAKPSVFLIGDSFVASSQVPPGEGWGHQAEQILQKGNPKLDIRSLGIPGAGTTSELALLQDVAIPKHADLVLLAVFASNDIANNHPELDYKLNKPFTRYVDGKLQRFHPTEPQQVGWLWNNSHIYRWLLRVRQLRSIVSSRLKHGKGIPLELRIHDPEKSQTWEEAWTISTQLLTEFAAQATKNNIPVGFIILPAREQVSELASQKMRRRWPQTKNWDVLQSHRKITKICQQLAPTLDLRPLLMNHKSPETLYFQRDGHWTTHGHQAAATAAAKFITDFNLSPNSTTPSIANQ